MSAQVYQPLKLMRRNIVTWLTDTRPHALQFLAQRSIP